MLTSLWSGKTLPVLVVSAILVVFWYLGSIYLNGDMQRDAFANAGMAVLLISSELEELMAISDRILVLHNGRIIQNMNRRNLSSEEELHHAIQGHRIKQQASDVAA